MPMSTHLRLLLALITAAAAAAFRPVCAEPREAGWSGEAELGGVGTGGNSRTRSFNFRGRLSHSRDSWVKELAAEALRTSDHEGITYEYLMGSGRLEYRLGEHTYLFTTARYEQDRFNGYDHKVSETLGVGRQLFSRDGLSLDLEVGLGGRHHQFSSGGRKDEAIVRGAGRFSWEMNPVVRVGERFYVESSHGSTYAESETALRLKVNEHFATKFSLTVRHNTDNPEWSRATDSVTAVTLVYDF